MLIVDELCVCQDDWRGCFSLTLRRGEILGVLGHSGAGKSTLMALLAGFLRPDSGRLLSRLPNKVEQDLLPLAPAARPFTSLFQSHNLFEHLNARDNIGLGLHPNLRLDQAQQATIVAAAQRLGIADLLNRRPDQLSGGQQQRVALARCLVRRQPFLLLDEPFSALDPALRQEMLAELANLARDENIGVLFITHQPDEVRQIGDRFVLIESGAVAWEGSVEELAAPKGAAVSRYLGLSAPAG
ncbi:MAG: thiamine ABC transporter ATP-binding protein [Aeromonadaceae bacterium]|nr:thiamine ABC transporter ATP-binding protein [Aeromonadaceae bacterium]